jgi:Acetyltransferase (GNAT) domain
MTGGGFCIRGAREGDEVAILDMLNRVFAPRDPAFRPRSDAWWDWKYRRNPHGSRSLVVEDPEGRVVGHYGGLLARMQAGAAEVRFSQSTDSVTDPAVRRGLRNPGTFVRLAQAWASSFGGSGCDGVMYGLPIPEAYRIGARYLDYWMLRPQPVLVCRDPARLPAWAWDVHAIEVPEFPPETDDAWTRIAPRYGCVLRRDAAFLNWRFRDHWERPYRMAVARAGSGGPLRGHVVYREGTFAGTGRALIADWFVDPDDAGAARSLLRWATERAAQGGHPDVLFSCPTTSVWFTRFQEWGFEVDRSPYVLVARPYDQRFPPAWLREHWYYTLADFDVA